MAKANYLAVNTGLNAITALLNNGFIDIYDGTPPVNADTALSGNTKLAHITFGATAFANAVNGVATANAITADSSADATGTAAFARLYKSDGTTIVMDVTVTATGGGGDLQLTSTSITVAQNVAVDSFTITFPRF